MSKVTNEQLINAIVKEMPSEHAEHLKDITDPAKIMTVMDQYPTVKNSFIDTLVNKVGKTLVFSKTYENPLKALKKGKLAYGDSIEELFVDMAQMKNFGEHWEGSTTSEGDLIRELKPVVNALYIKKNLDKKFKQTIKDKELRKAFYSPNGLSQLIQRISSALQTALNYCDFEYTKKTLLHFIQSKEVLADAPTASGDTYEPILPTLLKNEFVEIAVTGETKEALGKNLAEEVRAVAGNMQFMTDKYNLAGVKTFSNPSDLRLFTTPATTAMMDVHVLASAFNVSSADLNTKTILIDEMPILEGKEVLAILADQDLLQIWDMFQSMGTFNNPEGAYTNYFASTEGIFSICLFANVVIFYK